MEASLSWNGIGYGLRIAQMLGVHRKKSYGTHPTVEGELRKRVFWYVLCIMCISIPLIRNNTFSQGTSTSGPRAQLRIWSCVLNTR